MVAIQLSQYLLILVTPLANKYLLCAGTVLGIGELSTNVIDKIIALMELIFYETDDK